MRTGLRIVLFLSLVLSLLTAQQAHARLVLKNIARVKGQDETTLHGIGLVVGLKGTGDGADALPTIRALARSMELMGIPLSLPDQRGRGGGLRELKDAKNVALVMVTATIPATGAQRGDRLDCHVNAISAKSLIGGRMFITPLLGPDLKDKRVYAMVEGQIELDDDKTPTAGKVAKGCRLESDFVNDMFLAEGKLTIILDKEYADFQVAAEIADLINTQILNNRNSTSTAGTAANQARAIDQVRIEVPVPQAYLANNDKKQAADVVAFISELMSMQIPEPQVQARVVINLRKKSIVMSGDVEIGATVVNHKNLVVEAGQQSPRFVALDMEDKVLTPEERAKKPPTTKLKALLEALNAVKAKDEDVIEILKGLKRTGKLHAQLVFE